MTIKILSVVRYRGPDGAVQIITARATGEAMRWGLYLGNPAGTLADGSRVFNLNCGNCAYRYDLRWVKDGLIISISGNVPPTQLQALADTVAVE